MSTNTTSTSDHLAIESPASSSSSALSSAQESARKYGGLAGAVAAVPDPAIIARLANEFFAALPGAAAPAALSSATDLGAPRLDEIDSGAVDIRAIPGTPPGVGVPPAVVPDHPREMFSLPALPN